MASSGILNFVAVDDVKFAFKYRLLGRSDLGHDSTSICSFSTQIKFRKTAVHNNHLEFGIDNKSTH